MAGKDDTTPSQALKTLENAISAAENADLPLEEDHYFYSNSSEFKTQITDFQSRIQSMLTSFPGAPAAPQDTFKSVPDAHDWTVSLLDDTLARVDDALADAKRVADHKKVEQANQPSFSKPAAAAPPPPKQPVFAQIPANPNQGYVSYMQSTLKQKPQESFVVPMDNSNAPFVHNLQHIKEALVEHTTKSEEGNKTIPSIDDIGAAIAAATAAGNPPPHPLHSLLNTLEYTESQLQVPEIAHQYKTFEETPFQFIDTVAGLEAVSRTLAQSDEIAVDLEAHNYRSFQGFCCLMQLSTRQQDFIIDVLVLREHIGKYLAPLFANPKIVKILHGSDGDIIWLQRDFGIYMCNLFDTGQAARVLDYPGHGLGYLMERLCDFKADKRWQLADWRLRPLSDEAIHYARADTHYLLHCYDKVRQELVEMDQKSIQVAPHLVVSLPENNPGGALGTVLERSRQICLTLYEKELLKEDSYLALYEKINKNFSDEQLSVFSALYSWRDRVARQEDESFGYILSRNQLIALSEALPITAAELSRTLGRGAALLQSRAKEVLLIMAKAREDTSRVVEQKRIWREEMATRPMPSNFRGGGRPRNSHGGGEGILPDMAAAAAAAAASTLPPPPLPEDVGTASKDEGKVLLKPKTVKPLFVVTSGSGDGHETSFLANVSGMPPSPREDATLATTIIAPEPSAVPAPAPAAQGLKIKKVVPLGGSKATLPLNSGPPMLDITSQSSLFGSLLADKSTAGGGSGNGALAVASTAVPSAAAAAAAVAPKLNLGYGAVLPPTNFASRADTDLAGISLLQEEQNKQEPTAREKKNAVREAMTKLAADQAKEDNEDEEQEEGELVPVDADKIREDNDELEDFMPLSLSDKYNLIKKKKRRQQMPHATFGGVNAAAAAAGAAAGGGDKGRDRKKQKVDGEDSQKIKDTLKQLGLEGDEEDEEVDGGNNIATAAEVAPVDYAAAAAKYDFGIVNPHRRGGSGGRRGGRGGRGGRGNRGGGGGSGRGRGGKNGGDEPPGIPEGRFNPYAALDVTGLKGAKRSAVHVRSGNRSSR